MLLRSRLIRLHPPSRPGEEPASTSQGHPYTIFRRALERGNLLVAEATAREIGRISLGEALELTLLNRQEKPCSEAIPGLSSETTFNTQQRERREKMSDDAKFILGFG